MTPKEVQKLVEENRRLMSNAVFLTKQVSNRDKIIQVLEKLANGELYAIKV